MSSPKTHRRRKSSAHLQHGDIPSFLENSPFFLPISAEADLPKAIPRPTLKQLIRSKSARKSAGKILSLILFLIVSWYFWPRKGDTSYAALGTYGLLKGGGAQCLYDPKAVAVVPNPTSRTGREFEGLQWERMAYVTYVTKAEVLCNAVMIFEALKRVGSRARRVMIIPDSEEFRTEGYGSRSALKDEVVKRLLKVAVEKYGVTLVRVRVVRRRIAYDDWRESYTKLLAFNLTQYDRAIVLDSDASVLKNMDELFLLPPAPAAMPRAYWLSKPTLASHIMLIEPSAAIYKRMEKAIQKADIETYDMEIVNSIFSSSCVVLPHRKYALLTGEFRRKDDEHRQFLGNATWDAQRVFEEASLVHFSDHPMLKPWQGITVEDVARYKPECKVRDQGEWEGQEEWCENRRVWADIYRDFRDRRETVCSLGTPGG
ncbi:hypothetical protein HYFRA_00009176 [Hymenoscyphus fraxineus]|uniref:Glycosyltransferase family 8 protein n=1 Tax=Hymenoscyphus fraxineus TaxID=746836 RepID=A0A9N9KXT2_9HELO|nr:hypothetical protein HYFRA_00009176 [Hymenoscyphus fraxineus]